MCMHVKACLEIFCYSLTSFFQDIFQTAKPIPDYLQTFQTLTDKQEVFSKQMFLKQVYWITINLSQQL